MPPAPRRNNHGCTGGRAIRREVTDDRRNNDTRPDRGGMGDFTTNHPPRVRPEEGGSDGVAPGMRGRPLSQPEDRERTPFL